LQIIDGDYTLLSSDASSYMRQISASANDITVNSYLFSYGIAVTFHQAGAGQITFVEGSGVTINTPPNGSLSTRGQGSTVTLICVAVDEYDLIGDVELSVDYAGYDVAMGVASPAPTASEELLRHLFTRSVVFGVDFAGSLAKADTAATASTVLSVKKNGTEIGTITFAIAGTTGTLESDGVAASFAAGDVMTVVAPATPDATLAKIAATFKGSKV